MCLISSTVECIHELIHHRASWVNFKWLRLVVQEPSSSIIKAILFWDSKRLYIRWVIWFEWYLLDKFIVFEKSDIRVAIRHSKNTVPICFVIFPISFVWCAILPNTSTLTVPFIFQVSAFILNSSAPPFFSFSRSTDCRDSDIRPGQSWGQEGRRHHSLPCGLKPSGMAGDKVLVLLRGLFRRGKSLDLALFRG